MRGTRSLGSVVRGRWIEGPATNFFDVAESCTSRDLMVCRRRFALAMFDFRGFRFMLLGERLGGRARETRVWRLKHVHGQDELNYRVITYP